AWCMLISVHATRRPQLSTPSPYTTLFRSDLREMQHRARALQCLRADDSMPHAMARQRQAHLRYQLRAMRDGHRCAGLARQDVRRSEEHTSELQSRENLVCRLLPAKKTPRR